MPLSKEQLTDLILDHLMDINDNRCSITEDAILAEHDEQVQNVLAGLLTLHEDLQYRETERQKAFEKLHEINERLEQVVKEQSQAILELSTPILQLGDGVLVLPLIGTVDTDRAQQVLQQALEATKNYGASVLIIDVTGVPIVDTAVARHLLVTVDALKLLGAQTVLTGISPENAQTLVSLSVDLGKVNTQSSLRAGLEYAKRQTNKP